MTKIVFLDRNSLSKGARIRGLSAPANWSYYPTTSRQQVIERCTGADILVLSKCPITAATLAACPTIKHIAVAATGFNIIDLDACSEYGVSVSNIPSYADTTVSEHVICMALNLRRQMIQYRQQVINGEWQKSDAFCLFDKPVFDLAGCTMGIVGFGQLGQATARLAKAMGMKVIFSARKAHHADYATQVSFEKLVQTADIISVHCALNNSTSNLFDAQVLSQMQSHAILINTARGGIIDELALKNALLNKEIAAAGIDVLVEEPPQNDSPLLEIADLSNVIITPHSAWLSENAMQRLTDTLADNIDAFISGVNSNLVPLD